MNWRLLAIRQVQTPGPRYGLGLGWFPPRRARGVEPSFVEHLGGGLGVFNCFRLYPGLGAGVVVMSNTRGYDPVAVVGRIAEVTAA